MTTKQTRDLTLRDRLSRLDFLHACKLLGEQGKKLIQQGGRHEFKLPDDVYLGDDLFRVRVDEAIVTITRMAEARERLHWHCDRCQSACYHAGAAFALVLEEKTTLGLAAPPPEKRRVPIESLAEDDLVARALAERRERARTEKMKVQSADPDHPWTDYTVTSTLSGKTYRVALRGEEPGPSYCTCPDYRVNTLGTETVPGVVEKCEAASG
jgi:hypothetical protein